MTSPGRTPPDVTAAGAPAMPREVMLFLVQLSTVLGKARAYPAGHPMLTAALDILVTQLFGLLKGRPSLVIGVARRHLVVGGAQTDPDHAVLRDLADRIHRHQVATLQLRPGVGEDELGDLLAALAQETWRQGKPLGLEPPEVRAHRWPHIGVDPLPLDQLELGDSDAPRTSVARRAEDLWQGLVDAAVLFGMAEGGEGAGGGVPAAARSTPVSGADAARAIRSRKGDADYSRAVVDWLLQLGDHLGEAGGESPVHQRVADLFQELDPETLQQLLTLGATMEKRKDLVFRGARALPVKAVLDLLQAAARSSDRNISHSLVKILAKLASHLESAKGPIVPGAEEVLRDSVRQLVGSWQEEDTSPHRQLLDLLARPVGASGVEAGRAVHGTLRLVQLGLETGADTPAVAVAVRELADTGDLGMVLDLIDRSIEAGLDPVRVEAVLVEPDFVRARLLDDAEDAIRLDRLLDRLGDEAAVPLLEALEFAESASRRKYILQRLERFGPRLGPMLVARLPDKPWFVQRNLLSLLATLPDLPAGFSARAYAAHENARVRREAYKLMFGDPAERSRAIAAAVTDPDAGIVLLGLAAAAEQPPPDLMPKLLTLLEGSFRTPEVRSAAIRLLGARPTATARAWLLDQVLTTRGWLWFRREVLRPRSPDQLTALGVLARVYAQQPGVARALRLAAASGDHEVRQAVRREDER